MELGEKKQWLGRYAACRREIEQDLSQIRSWRALAEGGAFLAGTGRTRKGGDHSRVEQAVAEMDALERELPEKIEEMVELRRELGRAIGTLPKRNMRHLLYLRYVEGMTFARLGREMGYSEAYVYRLHREALECLGEGGALGEGGG